MSRLQKKCLIATVGGHLLLILVLVFGSAFFVSHSKPDESQILTVIPANLIDAAFSSGVAGAQPPPPQPLQPPQPPTPVQPRPEPPQPKPPEPQPEPPQPKQTLVEKVQQFFKPEPVKPQPDDLKDDEPEPKPSKTKPKEIKVNLTKVTRTTTTKTSDTSEADERREAQRAADARARAFRSAASSISKNTSSSTVVDMPGASTAAYANYKDALASIYYDAWTPPDDTSNDDAITKVSITIARDGTVISARIVGRSGDARVDASVQRAIDRVKDVPPLPEGSKENQRTVILNFNLKTKRMIG